MDVVSLTPEEIDYLIRVLTVAQNRSLSVRVAVDGGLKISTGQGMWTPPMGEMA